MKIKLISSQTENQKRASTSSSPGKEDRCYTARLSVGSVEESAKDLMDMKDDQENNQKFVLPKLCTFLSRKEKEEDFMAMKGCKLPHRPKKRSKAVQRTLLIMSPGECLSDLCPERYEVEEKKASKKRPRKGRYEAWEKKASIKRPRGLKAMEGMKSDSE